MHRHPVLPQHRSLVLALALALTAVAPLAVADPAPPAQAPGETARAAASPTIPVLVRLRGEPAYKRFIAEGGRDNAKTARKRAAEQAERLVQQQTRFAKAAAALGARERLRVQFIDNVIALDARASDIEALRALPDVVAVAPARRYQRNHTTSVPLLGGSQVWDAGFSAGGGFTGQGVTVAVIDEGIDYTHRHFGGTGNYADNNRTVLGDVGVPWPPAALPSAMGDQLVIGGTDLVGEGYDFGLTPAPDPDPAGCDFSHGTHVAGSIAGYGVTAAGATFTGDLSQGDALFTDFPAASVADFRIGPGVAPQANLVSIVVFGCSGSTGTDILLQAMDVAGSQTFLGEDVDVVNMSLGSSYGGSGVDDFLIGGQQALVDLGIVVVASAGNSGDVQLVTGAPASSPSTISVASVRDSSAVVQGTLSYTPTGGSTVSTPAAKSDAYPGASDPLTAGLALSVPIDACAALSEPTPTAWDGKWLIMDRGNCTFSIKLANTSGTGIAGVIIANNITGAPFTAAVDGNATPAVMISLEAGNALKQALAGEAALQATFSGAAQLSVADTELTASSFTSRGGAVRGNGGRILKPNIAGPGDTITSAGAGTNDQGYTISGTSMASPHIAGAVALMIDADGSEPANAADVARIKQRLMNSATRDVGSTAPETPPLHSPQRIGAGFADVAAAINTSLVAYAEDSPENVALSLGYPRQLTGSPAQASKSITLENLGPDAVTVDTAYVARSDWGGAGFSVSPSSIEVPASGTASVTVTLTIDADAPNLNVSGDPLYDGAGKTFLHEESGYVTFTTQGAAPQTIRTPVYAAPALAGNTAVPADIEVSSTGSTSLAISGTGFSHGNDGNSFRSMVSAFGLLAEDGVETGLFWDGDNSGTNDPDELLQDYAYADLKYVGAQRVVASADRELLYVALATHGEWTTPKEFLINVRLDLDDNGSIDYVWYQSYSSTSDTFLVSYDSFLDNSYQDSGDFGQVLNYAAGESLHSQLLANNVLVLPLVIRDDSFSGNGWVNYAGGPIRVVVSTYQRDSDEEVEIDRAETRFVPGIVDIEDSTAFAPIEAPTAFAAVNGGQINLDYGTPADGSPARVLTLHHHNADPALRAQVTTLTRRSLVFRNGFESDL